MQGKRVIMVVTLGVAGWLVIPLLARVQQARGGGSQLPP